MKLIAVLAMVAGLVAGQKENAAADAKPNADAAAAAADAPAEGAAVEGRTSGGQPRFFGGSSLNNFPGSQLGLQGGLNSGFQSGFNPAIQGGFNPAFQGGQNGQLSPFLIGGQPVGGVGGGLPFPIQITSSPLNAAGPVTGNCRRWCRRPPPQGGVYCCEKGTDPISPVGEKPGFCPAIRSVCPRFTAPPVTCSNDGSCIGVDKCCWDTCLCRHTCKTPVNFPQPPGFLTPGECRNGK